MRCAPSIPPTLSTKEPPQHAANRLAAVGQGRTDSSSGGRCGRECSATAGLRFTFTSPMWRKQISLMAIRGPLGYPGLDVDDPDTLPRTLGAVDLQRGILVGRFLLLAIGGQAPSGPQGRYRVKWYLMVTET